MMDNFWLVAISIVGRAVIGIACVLGAVELAREGQDGWGWLIFLAALVNSYSVAER